MLEALITRSRLHRVQALLPSCGSNHDAFNRAPPGTALTPEGGQGGRGGRSRGHPASRGGSSGQLATGHPLKRHFASFTSSFLLFHPPLALKSHPQPATPRRICARVPNRPPTVWRIPPTSTTSNSHRLTSRAITPGVARSRPSRSLHFFFSSLSLCAVCSVQGCDPKVLQDGSSVSPAPPPFLLHRVRPPPPSFAFAFARHGVAKAIAHRLAIHFKSVECALRWCPAFRNRISLHWLSFSRRVPASHGGCANPPCFQSDCTRRPSNPTSNPSRLPKRHRRKRGHRSGEAMLDPGI